MFYSLIVVVLALAVAEADVGYNYAGPNVQLSHAASAGQHQPLVLPPPGRPAPFSLPQYPTRFNLVQPSPLPAYQTEPNYFLSQGSQLPSQANFDPAGVEVHKHIYVHVPPPEAPEEVRPPPPLRPPRRNYKIIFVKVPSPAPSRSNSVSYQQYEQPQQAPEEKTIVYVLVGKPNSPPVLQPLPVPPPKPEVYFIRYGARNQGQPGPLLSDYEVQASSQPGHAQYGPP